MAPNARHCVVVVVADFRALERCTRVGAGGYPRMVCASICAHPGWTDKKCGIVRQSWTSRGKPCVHTSLPPLPAHARVPANPLCWAVSWSFLSCANPTSEILAFPGRSNRMFCSQQALIDRRAEARVIPASASRPAAPPPLPGTAALAALAAAPAVAALAVVAAATAAAAVVAPIAPATLGTVASKQLHWQHQKWS
jgi:hypothetical protein